MFYLVISHLRQAEHTSIEVRVSELEDSHTSSLSHSVARRGLSADLKVCSTPPTLSLLLSPPFELDRNTPFNQPTLD